MFDEADRLLSDSFGTDLEFILDSVPKTRQTLMFTATMTPTIEALDFARSKPFVFRGNTRYDTVDKLHQTFLFVPSMVKDTYLHYILKVVYKMGPPESAVDTNAEYTKKNEGGAKHASKKSKKAANSRAAITKSLENNSGQDDTFIIIFCGKWKTCERVYLTLRELGIRCTSLHSKLSQSERLASIAKFKSGLIRILVTTDVGLFIILLNEKADVVSTSHKLKSC